MTYYQFVNIKRVHFLFNIYLYIPIVINKVLISGFNIYAKTTKFLATIG